MHSRPARSTRDTRVGSAVRRPAPATGTASAAEAPDAGSEAPVLAPGAAISLDTPGLVRPRVLNAPAVTLADGSGARPSVLLEILVDEKGRVVENRILRVDRIPPGFAKAVAEYGRELRFEPARLRGAPVRVWIPHEMRFEVR